MIVFKVHRGNYVPPESAVTLHLTRESAVAACVQLQENGWGGWRVDEVSVEDRMLPSSSEVDQRLARLAKDRAFYAGDRLLPADDADWLINELQRVRSEAKDLSSTCTATDHDFFEVRAVYKFCKRLLGE